MSGSIRTISKIKVLQLNGKCDKEGKKQTDRWTKKMRD